MLQTFKRLFTKDQDLMSLQDNVNDALLPLFLVPLLSGNLLENLSLTTSTQQINHKLDRAWRGFFVVKSTADIRVFSPAQSTDPKVKIPLQASSAGTVSVWVF